MKAIRVHQFGGPEVLQIEEVPDPTPGAKQVVVAVRAVGINPVDTYIRTGTYNWKPPLPYTPGTDGAGIIESVGAEVDAWKTGDRVWIKESADAARGTYAEKVLCNLNNIFSLPNSLSFPQGAGVNVPYVTAYHALFQVAHALPGETVLVHGATGGVGLASVQFAVVRGLRVIASGGSEAGRKLVMEQGAEHVLDHHKEGYLDEIKKFTSGRGADVICEMLANKNLARDLQVLAPRGRVAVIGSRGTIEVNPRDLMKCHGKILGVSPGNETERAEATAAVTAGLFSGVLRPIIDAEFPLADARQAHEEVMGNGSHGKIVLIP